MKIIDFFYQKNIRRTYPLHLHPYHELHYISSGYGQYLFCEPFSGGEAKGHTLEVPNLPVDHTLVFREGDLFISPPQVPHVLQGVEREEAGQYIVIFDTETAAEKRLMEALYEKKLLDRCQHLGLQHLPWFESTRGLSNSKDKLDQDRGAHELLSFLYDCSKKRDLNARIPAHLGRALQMIQEWSDRAIVLEDVAQKLGISPAHLSRSFKRAFGQSPLKYHTKIRMERAEQLLRHRSDPLSTVAHLCGYNNEFHFSKVFKQTMGRSPSQCRGEP